MKLVVRIDTSEEGEPQSPVPISVAESFADLLGEELEDLFPDAARYECAEISLSFLSSDEMRCVNRDYRGRDEPTDVLAFPLWEEEGVFLPNPAVRELFPLGDILICPAEIERLHEGMPCDEAVCLLLAHGFLHLLAWDHDTEAQEDAMWERQDRIKKRLLDVWRGASSLEEEC